MAVAPTVSLAEIRVLIPVDSCVGSRIEQWISGASLLVAERNIGVVITCGQTREPCELVPA